MALSSLQKLTRKLRNSYIIAKCKPFFIITKVIRRIHHIDGNIIESKTEILNLNRRIWLTKFVSGFSSSASKVYARKT